MSRLFVIFSLMSISWSSMAAADQKSETFLSFVMIHAHLSDVEGVLSDVTLSDSQRISKLCFHAGMMWSPVYDYARATNMPFAPEQKIVMTGARQQGDVIVAQKIEMKTTYQPPHNPVTEFMDSAVEAYLQVSGFCGGETEMGYPGSLANPLNGQPWSAKAAKSFEEVSSAVVRVRQNLVTVRSLSQSQ